MNKENHSLCKSYGVGSILGSEYINILIDVNTSHLNHIGGQNTVCLLIRYNDMQTV